MITSLRRRVVAVLAAAAVSATATQVLLPTPAGAATTTLFNQTFKNNTANGVGAVVLPTSSGGTNMACLTASGNTTVVPTSCTTANDVNGSGFLRLTDNGTSKVGGVFAAASVPTAQGLDLSFNTYQYGTTTTPADGIAFALAAVDPTNPVSPPNIGYTGGSLGYAPYSTNKGLAYGYLGIGLDVFGNYSNSAYQGTGCAASPAWISASGQVKGQVVVKGPGNGTVGYCPIQSTATTTTSAAIALRSNTRTASKVPVQVVINPNTSAVISASGLTVAAKSYAVAFTPVGGTQKVLTSTLPTVGAGLSFPASYLDSSGLPKQLAFGFVASTGGSVDYHELDQTTVTTLNGSVPQLTVAQSAYTAANLAAGDPVTYVVKAGVEAGLSETGAVSVTETMPTGVKAVSGSGPGWTCATPVQNATTLKYSITCTNNSQPFAAGSTLPNLTINGTATAAVTSATIGSGSVVTASSANSNPGYGNTTVIVTPASVPSNLTIAPASGPSGTAVVITGTNTSAATAIQVGTTAELAAATGTTLAQCTNNVAAAGCFTTNANGSLGISSMPTHAVGAVSVKVVTLGSSGTVGFTYTSVPGTPTVTAAAGVLSATASWDVPASGGSAITGYVLTPYKDGVAQTAVQIAAGTTTYTVANATAGSSYTFTVAAKNANGTGVASTLSDVAVPYTVPSAPTSAAATAGTSGARLTWTTPSSNGYSAITGYVITPYLGGVAQTAQTFNSTATTQTVTGLTAGSSYTFTVAAINAAGTGPASATTNAVTVNAGPTITSTPQDGEVGIGYRHQFTQSGGTAGYTYDLTSGTLPDGLSLSAGGLISGTPTAAGTYTFRARVTDSYNEVSTKTFTVVIAAQPILTFTGAQPDAQVGSAYSTTFTRTGGTGPFTFSTVSGTLPPGLTLNTTTGVLSGTPTSPGDYAFTVKVVDALGASDTKGASLSVRTIPAAPTIGTVTGGTTSAVVRWTAPTAEGNSPITGYVVTPYLTGVAQTPVTFDSTSTSQTLTGLTAGGTYTFRVAAKNTIGTGPASAASGAVTLNSVPAITSTPPNGEVGAAYSHQLVSSGGTAPLSYAITADTLPAGLSISSAGLIFGTPTTAGSSTFTVKVTDADGATSARQFTVVVAAPPTLTYSSPLTTAIVGDPYSKTLTRSGGTGPFTFSISTGTLPAGLTLNTTTGVLSGTPTTPGDYAFTARVVDAFGMSDTKATTIAVRSVPSAPIIGAVTGGTTSAVVRWAAPTSDGNSALTGYIVTPYLNGVAQAPVNVAAGSTSQTLTGLTAGGTYTFTVAGKNAIGTGPASAASAPLALNGVPTITSTPPNGEVGAAYNHQLTSSGGTDPLSYAITAGTLPAGLSITSRGLVFGTPTTAGSSTFTVTVTDADVATSSKDFTVVIAAPPALTYSSPLPVGQVGDAYSRTLTRTGGTGPFVFSVPTGSLPAGLTLNTATGVLSGTPTAAGDYAFTVKVVDSFGQSDTRETTLAVRTVPSAPAVGNVTPGTSSAVVRWTAPTSDGNSAVTGYVVTPYLSRVAQTPVVFDSTATIQTVTGLTPGGVYTFTIAARNAAGTGPASATTAPVTLNAAPVITSTPGDGEVGVAYVHQFTASGGTGTLSWDVTSGSLPAGLTLSNSGKLSGTPTTDGDFTFRVKVTDEDGDTVNKQFTVTIAAVPNLTFPGSLPRVDVGAAYDEMLTHTGGTGPFTFSVSAGSLPPGLTLDPATGRLTGTPTTGGSYSFTVRILDSLGQSDTKAASLAVRAAPAVALAVSQDTVRFGDAVTLTADLDPSDATGTVTFQVTTPIGTTLELGPVSVVNGRASISSTLGQFGANVVVARYNGDADHLAKSSIDKTVEVAAYTGQAIITEFRTSGPGGGDDSYVEIYNAGPTMPLAGLTLESTSGTTITLPATAPRLNQYRSYLFVGSDFSLGGVAAPDVRRPTLGTGGYRLVAADTGATVIDEAGPSSGFHLGTGLPAIAGSPNDQWAYVRIETSGRPNDTRSNRADYALVSSTGAVVGGVQSMRGSASPTGLGDSWQRNGETQSFLLDGTKAVDVSPNREYVVGRPGTLVIRRTITNTGNRTITEAKARTTAMSEANGLSRPGGNPATIARIRAVNPATATSRATVAGRGSVTVQNLSVDAPITDAAGGGLNSTFAIPLPSDGLAPGQSVDVSFTFEVDVRGTFWFGYDVDARSTAPSAGLSRAQATKVVAKTETRLLAKGGKQVKAVTLTSGKL